MLKQNPFAAWPSSTERKRITAMRWPSYLIAACEAESWQQIKVQEEDYTQ